jgi:hypothetical protein
MYNAYICMERLERSVWSSKCWVWGLRIEFEESGMEGPSKVPFLSLKPHPTSTLPYSQSISIT